MRVSFGLAFYITWFIILFRMFFFRIILTWLSCLLIIEALSAVDSKKLISILVLSLLIVVISIFDLSLDLLALTALIAFLVTLSFILILLISLEGTNKKCLQTNKTSFAFYFLFLSLTLLLLSFFLSEGFSEWFFSLRWLDLYRALSTNGSSIVSVLHYLSTRFYLLEFCLLNIWIIFILLLSLLSLLYLWSNSRNVSSRLASGSRLRRLSRKKSSARSL